MNDHNACAKAEERVARCYCCKRELPSEQAAKVGIIERRPESDKDIFYCGCKGWS